MCLFSVRYIRIHPQSMFWYCLLDYTDILNFTNWSPCWKLFSLRVIWWCLPHVFLKKKALLPVNPVDIQLSPTSEARTDYNYWYSLLCFHIWYEVSFTWQVMCISIRFRWQFHNCLIITLIPVELAATTPIYVDKASSKIVDMSYWTSFDTVQGRGDKSWTGLG